MEKLTICSTRIDPKTRALRHRSVGTRSRKLYIGGKYRLLPGASLTLPTFKVFEVLDHVKQLYAAGMVDVLMHGRIPVDIDALPGSIVSRRPIPGTPKQPAPLVDTLDKDLAVGVPMPLTKGGSAETGEVFDSGQAAELARLDAGIFGPEEPTAEGPQAEDEEPSEPLEDSPADDTSEQSTMVSSGRRGRRRGIKR